MWTKLKNLKMRGLISCPKDNGYFFLNDASIQCENCSQSFSIKDGIIVFYDCSIKCAEINGQKMFYESLCLSNTTTSEKSKHESLLNKTWAKMRNAYSSSQIDNKLLDFFISKLNPLSGRKVLEIGCYSGTPGTDYCLLNKNTLDCYVGIDIALSPLVKLNKKLIEANATNFYLFNMDINDNYLINNQFDLIFGRGILHHFESPEKIAERIKKLLSPSGKAVFLEPLNTNMLIKFLRFISKPFRPNLTWEHPFSSKDLNKFVKAFRSSELYYYDGLSILSLIFLLNKKMFNLAHNFLFKMDEILSKKNSWYKKNFLRAVIVVSNND